MVSLPTLAQETTDRSAGVIEEVMVTAQRRTERLEDVPMAISVVTGSMMERAGMDNIEDISRVAAGVQVNRGGAFSQPAIRGISTLTLGNGLENNVAVYVDGVYQPDAVAINAELANIASVQILKGPQGTLYGRNATGGAIVIDTLAPSDEFEGNVKASYGRFDDTKLQGYVSGPITDNVGFSLAGNWRESDGYIEDVGDDPTSSKDNYDAAPLKSSALRAKLKFTPTEDLDINLGYNYVDYLDARGLAYRIPKYAVLPGGATAKDKVSLNIKGDNAMELNEGSLGINWQTGIGNLAAVTAFAKRKSNSSFDFDGTKIDLVRGESKGNTEYTLQQTLNLNIDSFERLNINVGGMYYDDRYRQENYQSWRYDELQYTYNLQTDAEAFAAYVDATWEFSDDWFLTLGARYSEEQRRGAYQVNNITGAPTPSTDKSKDYDATTPRAVLRYQLDDNSSVYASYTTGFRSGVFNTGIQPDPILYTPVDQEEITAYEVGFKTAQTFYRLSAAAYYYDYTDLQVGITIPNPIGTGVVQSMFNAPQAEVYGAEAEIDVSLGENLNLRAGLAYIHGEYTDFPDTTGVGLDAASQSNISPQFQDWTDQEMARAPEWTANLGIDYTLAVADGELTLSGNVNYSDSYVVQNLSLYGPLAGDAGGANEQRYRQDSFVLVNARADWTSPGGSYSLAVYGDNLTDERYFLTNSGSSLGDYNQYAWPVTYGVSVGYNF
ncbi:TonB-dependent receptor [Haliea sp. E17]|uniref:TonB-dependent receptor n=1 Tax=Haliea sp. E17 TaxID=3401576 RepID=UPI003AADAF59